MFPQSQPSGRPTAARLRHRPSSPGATSKRPACLASSWRDGIGRVSLPFGSCQWTTDRPREANPLLSLTWAFLTPSWSSTSSHRGYFNPVRGRIWATCMSPAPFTGPARRPCRLGLSLCCKSLSFCGFATLLFFVRDASAASGQRGHSD
ncbi:hypothetical protein ACCO45_009306 [Purpureocillium lilacinum]|uniref:Uncharacterized protein n=1 Tax=Purpureocillium lilacinum TaxID=33203 RepID=A0ACC4DJB3_PURLI